MRFIYNFLSYAILPFALLKLAKNRNLSRVLERLGIIDNIKDQVIWVHCVSVGEFLAAKSVIDELLKRNKILITTTTKTASDCVIKHYKNTVYHRYFPFDCPLIIKKYIKKIKPKMVLIMETEIWVNLTYYLHKNNVPILLINARLNKKSYQKYQKFSTLTRQTLEKFNSILTQDKLSEQRFAQLGANKNTLKTIGNIKFEQNIEANKTLCNTLKTMIGTRKIVVFASTHQKEEQEIISSYLKFKKRIDAVLLIIPRHPERFEEVYKLSKKHGLSVARRSKNCPCKNAQIFLGDSMGEMMSYLQIADIVFMGGSLSNTGGHNMLEPAALAKPILFGKNVFNFAKISQDLLIKNAAIQVENADELFTQIINLLGNPEKSSALGENAQQYFKSQQGAIKRLMREITLLKTL